MTGNRYKRRYVAFIALCCLFITSNSYADIVITHPQVGQTSLTQNELRAIFSMQHGQWENGSPIRVFVYDDRTLEHKNFCKKILKLFPYQLRKNWDRLIYSGTGQAPQKIESEIEMLRMVSSTPGAIGYIRQGGDIDNVTVVIVK